MEREWRWRGNRDGEGIEMEVRGCGKVMGEGVCVRVCVCAYMVRRS